MIWRSPAVYSSLGFLYTSRHSIYEQKILLAYWYNNQRANRIMHIYIRVYINVSKIFPCFLLTAWDTEINKHKYFFR